MGVINQWPWRINHNNEIWMQTYPVEKIHLKAQSALSSHVFSRLLCKPINSWNCIDAYSTLWLPMSWCWSTRPSVTTVLAKYTLHWTSFRQNVYIYSEQHNSGSGFSAHDDAVPLEKYTSFCRWTQNMNDSFNNYICSASHMHPGPHFQNV